MIKCSSKFSLILVNSTLLLWERDFNVESNGVLDLGNYNLYKGNTHSQLCGNLNIYATHTAH